MGCDALTSFRLRRLGSGVAAKSSGEPAGPLLRFELMIAATDNLSTFTTGRVLQPVKCTRGYQMIENIDLLSQRHTGYKSSPRK